MAHDDIREDQTWHQIFLLVYHILLANKDQLLNELEMFPPEKLLLSRRATNEQRLVRGTFFPGFLVSQDRCLSFGP